MKKSSIQKRKETVKTNNTNKRKWIISLGSGIAAVIIIVVIAFFSWPKFVTVTKLKVKDMVVGTGSEAKIGDTLIVEYVAWLYGKPKSQPFDSSGRHDKPYEFVLGKGQAIAGWDQGLAGMKVGGTRKLIIPPDMAYGAKGALNGIIPPNAALIFDVELLEVIKPFAELPPTSIKALKVEDRIVGTGAEAKIGNTLTIHYTGWLENGKKFDSSLDRGQPIEFVLGNGQVIAGWEQGLIGMKVGGTRKLTIPPNLGYGAQGIINVIPPNAALIFEVELLAVW